MKRLTVVFTAVLLVGISTTEVKAQSVTITSVVSEKGSMKVGGKATVPGGWMIKSVSVFAPLPDGVNGEGGNSVVEAGADGSYMSDTMKVPPEKYSVVAMVTATDATGKKRYFFSSAKMVDATGGN